MARAGFRLEPLLRIRRMEEDQARRVVAERLRRIREVDERAEALRAQLAEGASQMRELILGGRIVPAEATRQRGYIGRLQVRILEVQNERQAHEAQLAIERAALAEASKRYKILARLKERQELRRRLEMARAEQRASDELGVMRFTYRLAQGEGDAGAQASPEM